MGNSFARHLRILPPGCRPTDQAFDRKVEVGEKTQNPKWECLFPLLGRIPRPGAVPFWELTTIVKGWPWAVISGQVLWGITNSKFNNPPIAY